MHVMMQMTAMLRLKLMKKKPFMIHHWSVRMNCLNKTLSMMKSLISDDVYESNDDESNDEEFSDDES